MADLLDFPLLLDFPSPNLLAPAEPLRETPSLSSAQPSRSQPPDHDARLRALDIESSWIVEAPAGSGKTGLLMQRLLKLLALGRIAQPEEVLAITFTRKATAELRERVLSELIAARSGVPPLPSRADDFRRETRALAEAVLLQDERLGWGLLDRPERLNIRTIDSVCSDIGRALPLLSGNGGVGEPVDDPGELYNLAAGRTLGQLGGTDPALHEALRTLLLHRDGSLSNCTALIARMIQTREQWGQLVPLGPGALTDELLDAEVRPRLERALEGVVCPALSRALDLFPPGILEELTAFAVRSAHHPGYRDQPSCLSPCAGRDRPPGSRGEDLDHWVALGSLLLTKGGEWRKSFSANHLFVSLPKDDARHLKEIVARLQGNTPLQIALCALQGLPPACYPEEQWTVVKALFRVLRHALVELKLLFAERRQCDFTEVSLAAREVLNAPEGAADLAEAAGLRLRHLLVDEMQDTSSSQYDLLELLIRDWGGEGETVFLVGDPKQSIYLFRQARVERFLRTFREGLLGHFPVKPLRLTANFRTQARLVEGFNRTFADVFPRENAENGSADVPFVAADALRPTTARADLHWHAGLLAEEVSQDPSQVSSRDPSANASTGSARRNHALRQARSIRQIIETWQSRPLPPGRKQPWRIAVLARNREHLAPVITEFDRRIDGQTLPYRAVEIDPLATREEVLDLVALTRALLHPADRVAWLAVLHAPWCGLGRADLLALTGEGPGSDSEATVARLVISRSHRLSTEGQALLARAWPVFQTAIDSIGATPFSVHVERTWRSLGGDAPLSPEALTNALRFLSVLRTVEREGGGRVEPARLLGRLHRLYAEPRAGLDAVELSTIHRSKGLEWDVVLVPALERQAPATPTELLNWIELDSAHAESAPVILAPIFGKGEASDKLNDWLREVRSQRELAEAKRLLYVASTRAREELHLFGACVQKADGSLSPPVKDSLLGACWDAAEPVFQGVARSAAEGGDTWTSYHAGNSAQAYQPTLLPFPQLDVLSSDPFSMGSSSDGLALAAAAETDAAELELQPAVQPLVRPAARPQARTAAFLRRLPSNFDPIRRFDRNPNQRLPYTSAAGPEPSPAFGRPEGSFAARAFGNVVHRYLNQLSTRLAAGHSPGALLAELPGWDARVATSLRAEGVAPALANRETPRVLRALLQTLEDEHGRWILAPHAGAVDECSMTTADPMAGSFRVDRSFLAGPGPLLAGTGTVWIIDFKTGEPGGREVQEFLREERFKYQAQLEAYAKIRRSLPDGHLPVRTALYFPLLPALLHWASGDR